MGDDEMIVTWRSLWEFTKEIFVEVGLSPEEAETEADVLVWANLRGVDSHGVRAIPRYVEAAKEGRMDPRADVQIVKQTPSVALIEADHAFGPVVTVYAMEQTMTKAEDVGVGWTFIRNTTHQGAMGYYSLMAAKRDMAGIAWVCNPPNMAPYGAKAAGVHNSPITIAIPGNEHPPLILDMATSVAAFGKLGVAIEKGESIPEDWALDEEGTPTTDPHEAAVLRPVGGYKGYGLALMLECLSSLMVGNPLVSPTLLGQDEHLARGTQNSVVAAVDIGSFTEVERYEERVDELVGAIKDLPKAEGFDEILVPGEPEDRVYEQRRQHGIPLPAGTVDRLREAAEDLQVEMPPAV